MIGLPLFWDQYDNAQRLRETGFGERLPTYGWEPQDLIGAVDRLLGDDGLRARMRAGADAIRADPGHVRGADLVEQVARTGEPVTA
jgi:UDP:flavonoid glycosyltransferase YjiC (YdhE family)